MRSRTSAATRSPTWTWPPSPFLPMSCKSAPSSTPSRSAICATASAATGSSAGTSPASIRPIRPSASSRCTSTVNRWYGSRCGRQRTPAHSGSSRASRSTRSRASRAVTPASPARRMRRSAVARGARPTPADRAARRPRAPRARRRSAVGPPRPRARPGRGPRPPTPGPRRRPPPRSPAPSRSKAACVRYATWRACSNSARMSPSTAGSRGSSPKPISRAIDGWCSDTRRSVRRPVSRCSALRTRVRNSCAASRASRSPGRRSSRAARRSSHPTVATSRSPPAPSFTSGSSRCAAEPKRSCRSCAPARSRAANAAGSAATVPPTASRSSSRRPLLAGERARIEHRRRDVETFGRRLDRLGRRAGGVADLEAGVPERVQEPLGERGDELGVLAVVREQDVDVRARQLFAPPVPAHRGEREPGRRVGATEQLDEGRVQQFAPPPRRPQAVVAGGVRAVERGELLAESCDGAGRIAHARRVARATGGSRRRRVPSRRCGSGSPARPP